MKHFYLIVDVETTGDERVADFGAVVVDRAGNIVASLGVLVEGIFGRTDFHWSLGNPKTTQKKYEGMITDGHRALATPAYINRWLAEINATYSPVLTAYNIGFDWGKCRNTGIDLGIFSQRFCLWQASKLVICNEPDYLTAVDENDWYTPTGLVGTKADYVARYLDPTLPIEPHTALEDARDYEAVILNYLIHNPLTRKALISAGMAKSPSAKWLEGL